MTIRPGTNEVWLGDVGWGTWEEINRIPRPRPAAVTNFGWPCYEGVPRQGGYDGANLNICENLYAAGASAVDQPATTPTTTTPRSSPARAARRAAPRPPGSPSTRPPAGSYPAEYQRGAVLRRLHPRLHLGDAPAAPTACPTRPTAPPSPPRPATRSTWRSARTASSGTPTSRAAPSAGSGTPGPTARRRRPPPPPRPAGPPRSRSASTAAGRATPTGRPPDLRLGPRRRRRRRRRHRGHRQLDLPDSQGPIRRRCGSPTTRGPPAPTT